MSEPEIPSETARDHDQAARPGPRAVFAGRLRAVANHTIADGGPEAGPPQDPVAPPAPPPPSASHDAPEPRGAAALRDLIDTPEIRPMVWVHHPVTGAPLFRLPADLPDPGPAPPNADAEPPPLTAEAVLRELARIAFTDPLLPGLACARPRGLPAGTRARLPVTLRDKQTALLHLGRHLGLFTGRQRTRRPYAELSDHDLKARCDDLIRELAGMGVEVRIADDHEGAADRAPRAP